MSASAQMAAALDQLVAEHYYREDFELLAAVRAWASGLDEAGRSALRDLIARRVQEQPTIVEAVLCQAIAVPEAAPALAAWLARETEASLLSRALLQALRAAGGPEAYRAVERFVESEQEWEALQVLAELDFPRAWPRVREALRRDSQRDLVLHILQARRRQIGWDAFRAELAAGCAAEPALVGPLRRVLLAKGVGYNPFPPAEVERLLADLGQGETSS